MEINIRLATKNDCSAIRGIYEYYVLHTSITFEYDVPSIEEIEKRLEAIQVKYPYLVAESMGNVIGYAYATDFRYRTAYQWSPECSVYINKDFLGKGFGKKLYAHLFAILQAQGFYTVFAGVALPNDKSVALHLNNGFTEIGVFRNVGYKNGAWHSVQWFQKVLNTYEVNPPLPKKINEIGIELLRENL